MQYQHSDSSNVHTYPHKHHPHKHHTHAHHHHSVKFEEPASSSSSSYNEIDSQPHNFDQQHDLLNQTFYELEDFSHHRKSHQGLDLGETDKNNFYLSCNGGLLSGIPSLIFTGFLIYAVVVSNTTGVADACGSKLREYMLARLILSFVWIFALACAAGLFFACTKSPVAVGVCMGVLYFIYIAVMLGVGTSFVIDALALPKCVAALSAVSFTNSPLLIILGCITVGLDALMALILSCVGVSFGCALACNS